MIILILAWLTVGLLIFLTIFLTVLNLDIKGLYKNLKEKEKLRKKLKEEKIEVTSYSSRAFEYIEKLIQRSNIRLYIPRYNEWLHILISAVFMMLFYLWINSKLDILSLATNILVSTIFGLLGFMMPFLFLQILSEAMKEKIKKSSIDFLITFKNFLIILEKADIFDAFERTVEFLSEPLRSFVEIMVYERKKYKLNAIKCLNNFKEKLDNPDLHLFIENLKLCYIHGGDYIALTDEFIDEIGKINDIDDEENTEDMLLNMGLYFLLLINFGVIYFILHSKFKYEVLGNKLGSLIFILDFIIAIYIVIMTIKKPQDI